jgi:hypothetical protein
MSKFHWSEDTIMYFVELSKELNMQEFSYKVMDFIERDCSTEEDETFQDLYDDLMDVILKEITIDRSVDICHYSGLLNTKSYE